MLIFKEPQAPRRSVASCFVFAAWLHLNIAVAQIASIFFKYLLLRVAQGCGMIYHMNKPTKETTEAHGVRLPVSYWLKLRALMTYHGGRVWLEKAIDREAKKAGIHEFTK